MGEMSKVEEVARAIFDAMDVADGLDGTVARKYAVAAIKAMQGPTEAMLEAGAVVDDDFSEAAPERACFMIYHAMIDEALKE
jgi:hypothetical protein